MLWGQTEVIRLWLEHRAIQWAAWHWEQTSGFWAGVMENGLSFCSFFGFLSLMLKFQLSFVGKQRWEDRIWAPGWSLRYTWLQSQMSQSAALWYYRPTSLALSGIAGLSWFVFGLYQSIFLVRKGKKCQEVPSPKSQLFFIFISSSSCNFLSEFRVLGRRAVPFPRQLCLRTNVQNR